MCEAAGAVDVQRARAPCRRVASHGESGRGRQEKGLVLLGIVDQLHEFLCDLFERDRFGCEETCESKDATGHKMCSSCMISYTCVLHVGPNAPSATLKNVMQKGDMFMSAASTRIYDKTCGDRLVKRGRDRNE